MNFELTGDRIVGMKILGYEFEWDMGCVRKSNWKVPSPEMGEAAGRGIWGGKMSSVLDVLSLRYQKS